MDEPTTLPRKRNRIGRSRPKIVFPWYRWHALDFRQSPAVRLMTFDQRACYRELLDESWLEGSIPDDPTILARLIGFDQERFAAEVWPVVRQSFTERGAGRLVNARIERERAHARRRSDAARGNANERWSQTVDKPSGSGYASALPPHSDRNATAMRRDAIKSQSQIESQIEREIQTSLATEGSKNPEPPPVPAPIPPQPVAGFSPMSLALQAALPGAPVPSVRPENFSRPLSREDREAALNASPVISWLKAAGFAEAGKWWGYSLKLGRNHTAIYHALCQLKRSSTAGMVDEPWGYLETTYDEKEANLYSAKAEAESEARRSPERREERRG
jgi:uncharacterized protein YdaU (DUF1376 family)